MMQQAINKNIVKERKYKMLRSVFYPTESRKINSPFGPRELSADGFHDGIDIAPLSYNVSGDKIKPSWPGTVKVSKNDPDGYGEYIVIEHPEGFCTQYTHLLSRSVNVGEYVNMNTVIGLMGTSGHSTGAHLHFEIRDTLYNSKYFTKDSNGKSYMAVDPLNYLVEHEVIDDDPNLEYLVNQGIWDSKEYWQSLITKGATMAEVPVETFVAACSKIVERD